MAKGLKETNNKPLIIRALNFSGILLVTAALFGQESSEAPKTFRKDWQCIYYIPLNMKNIPETLPGWTSKAETSDQGKGI